MKIGNNLYHCEWCSTDIPHVKRTSTAPKGRHGRKGAVTNVLHCPNCNQKVSQK